MRTKRELFLRGSRVDNFLSLRFKEVNSKGESCGSSHFVYTENATEENEANAQHIVTMWNHWDEVIEALELAKKQISDLDDVLNQSNHEVFGWHLNGDGEAVSNFFEENDYGAIEAIEAILSKVKE